MALQDYSHAIKSKATSQIKQIAKLQEERDQLLSLAAKALIREQRVWKSILRYYEQLHNFHLHYRLPFLHLSSPLLSANLTN